MADVRAGGVVETEPFGACGGCRRFDVLMRSELMGWLRCPSCAASMSASLTADGASGSLKCATCGLQAPVRHGIPRFVDLPEDETARRTQSGETNFNDYFQGLDLSTLRDSLVLDGGCGMGRHARQIAPHAANVVAL